MDRSSILDHVEQILAVNPTLESKAKVKRLRQPAPTEFRLRVGDYRIFYNVSVGVDMVEIIQVLSKEKAVKYLEEST